MVAVFSSFSSSSSSSSMFVLFVCLFSLFCVRVWSDTDVNDVQALEVLYGALGNPSQLTGWKSSGGNPCSESWMGVKCDGSAVVSLELSSLGLNGTLGYLLSNLIALKIMDLSDNMIRDIIPFQMPPNLVSLNLAKNNLSGNLPYSILSMVSLGYLNVSGNLFSGPIADVFPNHTSLATLDLSHNNFSGDLPDSLSLLSNLSTLQVQNNQLTGSLDLLVDLPLDNLNVAHNNFTGSVPQELNSISNFVFNGNSFDNEPAPSPSPIMPPVEKPRKKRHGSSRDPLSESSVRQSSHENKRSSSIVTVIGMVLGASLLLLLGLLVFLLRKKKQKVKDRNQWSEGSVSGGAKKERQEQRITSMTAMADLKPLPAEKFVVDKIEGRNGSLRHTKPPITVTSYTIATLQTATNSFSQESIVGEGSLGRVYRADFSNGKVLAIKKIDNSALSLQEEDNFLEAVSNMSRLRHPNVVPLVGYCTEYGQRLLVYEYIRNGNLHDILHFSDDGSKRLTWSARVKVALGTARALEYLHEVCIPSIIHRNFKSANILLDEEYNPHLSDCGLAALTPNTEREVSTQMIGSFGYSAPEFTLSGIYTTKSDVYSFGVVMLELLTGRKPLDSSKPRSEQSLVRWATHQLHDIDALAKMVDPALNGMYPAKSLSRFADIIALCVQPEPEFRPPMSDVVQALVRLVQRAGIAKRRPSDESGYGFKTPDHEAIDIPI